LFLIVYASARKKLVSAYHYMILSNKFMIIKEVKIYYWTYCLSLLFLLSACGKIEPMDENSMGDSEAISPDGTPGAELAVLQIDGHKCIGCGKCVRFDPEHFSFDSGTRRAVVALSSNLSSSALAVAINICPTKAIIL